MEPRKRAIITQDNAALNAFLVAAIDEILERAGLSAQLQSPQAEASNDYKSHSRSVTPPAVAPPQKRLRPVAAAKAPKRNDIPGSPSQAGKGVEPSGKATSTGMPLWIADVLTKRTDQPFRSLDRPKECRLDLGLDDNGFAKDSLHASTSCAPSTSVRFTNDDLSRAEVIAQVDNKFICCSIPRRGQQDRRTKYLVLFDQHAADERVRVERYLAVMLQSFTSDTMDVRDLSEDPLLILLPDYQFQWLASSRTSQAALRRWGFRIDLQMSSGKLSDSQEVAAYSQISVLGVPGIVQERLSTQQGKEVQKIIQSYTEFLMQEGTSGLLTLMGNLDSKHDGEGPVAHAIMRWCPRRLLELVNSKACRGSIMFNDPLTLSQCQNLMQKLASTNFPFICAHGRPSLAPLMEYEERGGRRRERDRQIDWSKVDWSEMSTQRRTKKQC